MSVAEELYDLWEASGSRSVIVVGTAKNVGKTTTASALLRVAESRDVRVGLSSIGRDGEAFDAVDDTPKPRIFVEAGTVVAAGRALLPQARTIEILEEHERSALGPIVFYRSKVPQHVEISGAPTARAMRSVIQRLLSLGSERVIVDGAIDRVAVTATGTDKLIVATGIALAPSIESTVEATQRFIERLDTARIIACTTCPIGEGRAVDAHALAVAVAQRSGLPTFDIHADLRLGVAVRSWNR
jgi:Mrp family chromosome partitioning ATPase